MTLPLSISSQLPELKRCKSIKLSAGDTFIHAPGFEDRTLAFRTGMTADPLARAILLDYRPPTSSNRLKDVRHSIANLGVTIEDEDIIEYNRFEPGNFVAILSERLRIQKARRAVVDTSTMSKLVIILVLEACKTLKLKARVLYAEAQSYGPSEQEFESAKSRDEIHRPTLHSFTGVHGVVRVDALASVAMQGQPTAAIVFMSFNDALTQLLLNTVYPSRLFLINGRPPVHSWREKATAWVHEHVRKEWEEDNPTSAALEDDQCLPQRSSSTLDYRDSMGILLALYWELSATHRVLLAPSGSKMQTVSCFLMKALHPDVHIEYPSPEGFLPEYSSGVGTRWLVDFGVLSDRVAKIEALERQHYLQIEL